MITAVPRVAIAVSSMDPAIDLFRDGLGLPVCEFESVRESLGIRMALCAPRRGSHIELMAAFDAERAHGRSLRRFLDRRGEGLFALMLYAPDPNREAEDLARRGIEVMPLLEDAEGRDIHPRNTCGVLIRIYPADSAPRIEREIEKHLGPTAQRTSRAHLGGISRVRIAVSDFDRAISVYRDGLGLQTRVIPERETPGTRRAFCTAAAGAAIELVAPVGSEDGPGRTIAAHLRERGEGMDSLVLESDDPEATRERLLARGLRLRSDSGLGELEVDPALFGARIRIRARS